MDNHYVNLKNAEFLPFFEIAHCRKTLCHAHLQGRTKRFVFVLIMWGAR